MSVFASRLKKLRKQKRYSQERLATLIGVTKQAISQYERDMRVPDLELMIALCDILNVSMDYLTGKDDVTPLLLSEEELFIVSKYRALNSDGRAKLHERLEELLEMPRYTEKGEKYYSSSAEVV